MSSFNHNRRLHNRRMRPLTLRLRQPPFNSLPHDLIEVVMTPCPRSSVRLLLSLTQVNELKRLCCSLYPEAIVSNPDPASLNREAPEDALIENLINFFSSPSRDRVEISICLPLWTLFVVLESF